MELEKIIKRLDPFCSEISLKTSKICYMPIKLLKIGGVSGLLYSAYAFLTGNAETETIVLTGVISGIIYTGGIIADYFINKKADEIIKQKEEEKIQKEFEELYKEHIRNEVLKGEMIEKYPILEDYKLNKKFPEIKDVALHIYSRIRGKSINRMREIFPCFAKLELYNLGQYIGQLRRENTNALEEYINIKDKIVKKNKTKD